MRQPLAQGTQKEYELAGIPAPTSGRHQLIFNSSHRRKENHRGAGCLRSRAAPFRMRRSRRGTSVKFASDWSHRSVDLLDPEGSPPLAPAAGYPRRLPVAAGWCWFVHVSDRLVSPNRRLCAIMDSDLAKDRLAHGPSPCLDHVKFLRYGFVGIAINQTAQNFSPVAKAACNRVLWHGDERLLLRPGPSGSRRSPSGPRTNGRPRELFRPSSPVRLI